MALVRSHASAGVGLITGKIFPVSQCQVIAQRRVARKELVGAHVQQESSDDNNWYIYPICKKHNEAIGQSLDVADTYKLVPANVSQTCG